MSGRPGDAPAGKRLRVDPIACKAHAVCAELFPERIRLDDWGYPIIDDTPITPDLMQHARRAVAECPRAALRFAESAEPGAHSRGPD